MSNSLRDLERFYLLPTFNHFLLLYIRTASYSSSCIISLVIYSSRSRFIFKTIKTPSFFFLIKKVLRLLNLLRILARLAFSPRYIFEYFAIGSSLEGLKECYSCINDSAPSFYHHHRDSLLLTLEAKGSLVDFSARVLLRRVRTR